MRRNKKYDPHKTKRMSELSGASLATFKARFIAFSVDFLFIATLYISFITVFSDVLFPNGIHAPSERSILYSNLYFITNKPLFSDLTLTYLVLNYPFKFLFTFITLYTLYIGTSIYSYNGYTIGKKLMRIRVVSVLEKQLSLVQSLERAFGYTASLLEFGLGFMQYYSNKNRRTVHDRIAETIVIKAKKKRKRKYRTKPEYVTVLRDEEIKANDLSHAA